jgi:predicted Zn-dependent protease
MPDTPTTTTSLVPRSLAKAAPDGCALCALRSRRQFTRLLAGAGIAALAPAAWAQDGVRGDVGGNSQFTKLVSAERLEAESQQAYLQLTGGAASKGVLADRNDPQAQRLRAIAQRIIPFTPPWNARASAWRWQVNLLNDPQLNAFCMPGGKIAFYSGILKKLQLNDDEVAAIMGHEVAHALREHARKRIGQSTAQRTVIELGSAVLGLGNLGRTVAGLGGQILSLKFSRGDETEADLVGLDLAARAGYNPEAGLSLWRKMLQVSKGAPPQWMSTHPAGDTRIRDIESVLSKVRPLYAKAARPTQVWGPPPVS